MAKIPNPVIVVPGITGTYLSDEYALPPQIVWSVLTKKYRHIALHPDNPEILKDNPGGTWYELEQPSRVRSDQVFEIVYKELIEELRHNLCTREDMPVPVYPFGYDWRQPLDVIETQLAQFISEVIQRTKLLKHYDAADYAADPKVNLVGHSMGGMIITGYLQRQGRKAPVGKVATLATPYRGSFEAVLKIATGTANLGRPDTGSREREAARLTPALYHLLPRFPGAISTRPNLPDTLYNTATWQPGVVKTIEEFVRLHGLKGKTAKDRARQALDLFGNLLSTAEAHRNRIDNFRLTDAGLKVNDWLCVVGVDAKTRIKLEIKGTEAKPEFDLASDDRRNHWSDHDKSGEERRQTGDGTVPFDGAIPSFLDEKNLVCVTPDDYGYWEIGDRLISSAAGFHGIMPNMNMLHRMIVRHFTGRPDKHGNTWGRLAPGVSETQRRWPMDLELKN